VCFRKLGVELQGFAIAALACGNACFGDI